MSIASAFHLHGCESYRGIFEPFGGFADGYPIEEGYVRLPDAPGIGLEQKASLAPVLKDALGWFRATGCRTGEKTLPRGRLSRTRPAEVVRPGG